MEVYPGASVRTKMPIEMFPKGYEGKSGDRFTWLKSGDIRIEKSLGELGEENLQYMLEANERFENNMRNLPLRRRESS